MRSSPLLILLVINYMRISIIIPVYNGSQTIGRLAEELIKQVGNSYNLEIVLVNDCSPDNSRDACVEVQKRFPQHIKFYSLAKNVGEHNAVMAGLNKCTVDYAVIMDDDFQNPITEVIKLIRYIVERGFDVVYTYYEEKKHSRFRNLGSTFNDRVANVMLRKPRGLYLSSFKAINRFTIDKIISYTSPFPYVDGLILRTTCYIGKIKVEHVAREVGKSNYTLKKLVSLWSNMFINFSILPLRIMIVVGFLFAVGAFIVGLFVVYEKFTNPSLPLGYPSLVIAILMLSGIQLISIGVMGEYLGCMFLSQNKTPQYTIRESFE